MNYLNPKIKFLYYHFVELGILKVRIYYQGFTLITNSYIFKNYLMKDQHIDGYY